LLREVFVLDFPHGVSRYCPQSR